MLDFIENIRQQPEEENGRSRAIWLQKGGKSTRGLLEWTTERPEAFRRHLEAVRKRLPTFGGRMEEVHTLKIGGIFSQGGRTALFYECPEPIIDLREVLLRVPKPSGRTIRAFARAITAQIRSLHVHFHVTHTALRTESFVFLGSEPVNYEMPHLLDWARPAYPDSMYRHPEYRETDRKPFWFYQVWSLLMVLSEIAEWRPLEKAGDCEGVELLKRKLDRKRLLMKPEWESALTTQVFVYGFGILEKDRESLEKYDHWHIKGFYDKLCELLLPPPTP